MLIVTTVTAGCDSRVSAPVARPDQQQANRAVASDMRTRQLAFLNRIRTADPAHRTIDHAMVNEQNELGLILDRSVEMDKIPALLKTIITQMAQEFPGEDLNVIAYTPSKPPHKIGTAHLETRTGAISYQPAE